MDPFVLLSSEHSIMFLELLISARTRSCTPRSTPSARLPMPLCLHTMGKVVDVGDPFKSSATRAPPERFRRLGRTTRPSSASSVGGKGKWTEGSEVDARYQGKTNYRRGVIIAVRQLGLTFHPSLPSTLISLCDSAICCMLKHVELARSVLL